MKTYRGEGKGAWKKWGHYLKTAVFAHFCLSYLFDCYMVRRLLFTSRVFIICIFVSIGAGSCNIFVRTTSLYVSQGWIYLMLELIQPPLNRHHRICIDGKLIGQMPLIKNPDIIFLFFIKILSYHTFDVIANASLLENAVQNLSIMKFLFLVLFWMEWILQCPNVESSK